MTIITRPTVNWDREEVDLASDVARLVLDGVEVRMRNLACRIPGFHSLTPQGTYLAR